MTIKDILYYIKYYKNWIISLFIFTILFFISIFLSYFGSLQLLKIERPLLSFFVDSISYTLFIYMIATVLGIILIALVRLIGFFRKRDIEILLELKTKFFNSITSGTEKENSCPPLVRQANPLAFSSELQVKVE